MIALLVSAGLMGIALQSASGHWLGWVALIPLFLSMRRLTPLRALLAGAFWGLSLFLVCLFSLNQPFAPTLQSFLLLIAVPAAYVWGGVMLTRRVGFSPLLLALGWIGVELALQPLELRHGLLAGTQGHGLVVRTMGYLAGSFMVAFLVAYVNATLLEMLSAATATTGGLRFVPGPSGSAERILPLEVPVFLQPWFGPHRPRAPPA